MEAGNVGERVLVVDDEQATREFLGDFLTREGFECALAEDGNAALHQMVRFKPDIVVSDVSMPGLNGMQLLQLVRRNYPTTSIILITGYGTVSDAKAVIKQGASGYLLKPLTLPTIRTSIKKARDDRRTRVAEEPPPEADALDRLHASTDGPPQAAAPAATASPAVAPPTAAPPAQDAPVASAATPKQGGDKRTVSLDELSAGLLGVASVRMDVLRAHGLRVADVADRIAEVLNLAAVSREEIRAAARIHDIGKTGLPDTILQKPVGSLTEAELEEYREHPAIAAGIVGAINGLAAITSYVKHHHERYDGSGYPDRLREAAIPFGARVIALADAYDGLVAPATGQGVGADEAVQQILADSGRGFDPRVCQALSQAVKG